MFEYRIDIIKALKDKGYSTYRIRKEKIFGERTLQDFRDGKMVGMILLDQLCNLLDCQPNFIIRHVKDDEVE